MLITRIKSNNSSPRQAPRSEKVSSPVFRRRLPQTTNWITFDRCRLKTGLKTLSHLFKASHHAIFNSPILWIVAALFCLGASHAAAQSPRLEAQVTHTSPGAALHRGNAAPSALRKDDTLLPGDVIDTAASGSVVIALNDGSQVLIFPRSRVVLQDFQARGSWRDLLKVTVGRIRATINHYGKRPNPYRVYSPIASIAVRGTVFLVTVEPNNETRVLVYEGLVEVGSFVNPQKTVLVQPGRNIVVRPDGDISLVTTAPRDGLNGIRSLRGGVDQESNLRGAYNSRRSARFTAFNDPHIDALQNPAYATEFRQPSGRFYLAPSFSPEVLRGFSGGGNYVYYNVDSPNYRFLPQISYFIPLGSRAVVGAGASVTTTGGGNTVIRSHLEIDDKVTTDEGNDKVTTTNLSLIAARRFGQAGRTSFGMKFDYMIDRSSSSFKSNTGESMNFEPTFEEGKARGRHAALSVGLTQDIGDNKKLGVYYRYSMGSVEYSQRQSGFWRSRFINDYRYYIYVPDSEDFRTRPERSSEAGVLFRGSLARRLFYGVESSILFEHDQVEVNPPLQTTVMEITSPYRVRVVEVSSPIQIIVNDSAYSVGQPYLNKRRARRSVIGAGIGYALGSRAVLSLDLSTGRAREDSLGRTSYASDYARDRTSFRALHIGGQTNVWRNLFTGASLFYISEGRRISVGLNGQELSTYPRNYSFIERYKSLSVGWRLTPSWIAQYVYSTSYASNLPSHTLVIRYDFGGRKEKSPDQYPERY